MEQENKDARRGAARAISDEGGFERLKKQLADPRDSPAAAVAFLATVCKDHGHVEVAASLLQWAADDVPSSASYALNLLHAREILNDYEGALKAGERFFARGGDASHDAKTHQFFNMHNVPAVFAYFDDFSYELSQLDLSNYRGNAMRNDIVAGARL